MKRKNWNLKGKIGWCFAVIHGRLGEIYFQVVKGTRNSYAHCYINRKEFTKREQGMIDKDIKKQRLSIATENTGGYISIYRAFCTVQKRRE